MPPTRRTRGFSPYSYNIQYAKPGEGPMQKPRPYVNMAILPEEHLVIAKKDPNWFVYVTNSFNYILGSECQLVFDRVVSTLKIVPKSATLESFASFPLKEVAQKLPFSKIDIKPNSSGSHEWITANEVRVNHSWGEYVDCIVIADGKYIKVKKTIADPMIIKFDDDFDFRDYNDIFTVVYPISEMISSHLKSETTNFEYSKPTKTIAFENLFESTACVPLILDDDGFAYKISNADLMPNRIAVSSDEVEIFDKDDLEAEAAEINDRLNQIQETKFEPTTPVEFMVQHDEEYRRLHERLQFIDNKTNTMTDLIETHISKIIEYSFNDNANYLLQFGKNSDTVAWSGNSVIVTHNLDGYVNLVLDGAVDVNSTYSDYFDSKPLFDVVIVDKDNIRIDFTTPRHPVCTLRLFKVGEMK